MKRVKQFIKKHYLAMLFITLLLAACTRALHPTVVDGMPTKAQMERYQAKTDSINNLKSKPVPTTAAGQYIMKNTDDIKQKTEKAIELGEKSVQNSAQSLEQLKQNGIMMGKFDSLKNQVVVLVGTVGSLTEQLRLQHIDNVRKDSTIAAQKQQLAMAQREAELKERVNSRALKAFKILPLIIGIAMIIAGTIGYFQGRKHERERRKAEQYAV